MEDQMNFVDRMKQELSELNGKIDKLTTFMGSEAWYTLKMKDRHLLVDQKILMADYANILCARIKRAK